MMSSMKELYEKVARDSGLREKFEKITAAAEKDGAEATETKLTAFAKEAGYDVTMEEMRDYFRELTAKAEGEISEAELDMVAGGKGTWHIVFSVATVEDGCAVSSAMQNGQGNGCDHPGKEFGI